MAKKKDEIVEARIIEEKSNVTEKTRNDGRLLLGLVFVFVGALIFLNNFFPNFEVMKYFWPVVLIVFGLSLVSRSV